MIFKTNISSTANSNININSNIVNHILQVLMINYFKKNIKNTQNKIQETLKQSLALEFKSKVKKTKKVKRN